MVMSPTPIRDSAVLPCFHGCLASLISHHSLLHIPLVCLSPVNSRHHSEITSQSLNSSSQPPHHLGYLWLQKGLPVIIPFRLPQISFLTLSLKCFSSDPDNCPDVGDRTPASVPSPAKGRSNPTNTPIFPPSSFILPSFVWFYIFFSASQVLLSTLSWCSASTSVSEAVSLMYP